MSLAMRGGVLWLVFISAVLPAWGQGAEHAGASIPPSTAAVLPESQRLAYAMPKLTSGRNKAITGMVLYSASLIYDWAFVFPKSMKLNNRLMTSDTVSSEDLDESLKLLLIGLPGGIAGLIGPILSCSGGNSVYSTSRLLLDTQSPNPKIWAPYLLGWCFSGVGSLMGFAAGAGKNRSLLDVSIALGALGDLSWGYSVVHSVIYSNRQVRRCYQSKAGLSPILRQGMLAGVCLDLGF
jgi:hypothetical protein